MSVRKLLVFTSLLVAFCSRTGGRSRQIRRHRPCRVEKGSGSSATTLDLATLGATGKGLAIISHLGRSTFTQSFTLTPTGPLSRST